MSSLLENIAFLLMIEHPGARIDVQVTPQYRNMADGLVKEPVDQTVIPAAAHDGTHPAVRKGAFDVFLDASARTQARLHVSAGIRGVDLELAVTDLVAVTGARLVGAIGSSSPSPPPGERVG